MILAHPRRHLCRTGAEVKEKETLPCLSTLIEMALFYDGVTNKELINVSMYVSMAEHFMWDDETCMTTIIRTEAPHNPISRRP